MLGSSLYKWLNLCKTLLNSISPGNQETELMTNLPLGNAETSVLEQSWLSMPQSRLLVVGPHSSWLFMSCFSLLDTDSLTISLSNAVTYLISVWWIREVSLTNSLSKNEWWHRSIPAEIRCSKSKVKESLGQGSPLGSGASDLSRSFFCQGYEWYDTDNFCHHDTHKRRTRVSVQIRVSPRSSADPVCLPAFQQILCQCCYVNSVNFKGGDYGLIDFIENIQYR